VKARAAGAVARRADQCLREAIMIRGGDHDPREAIMIRNGSAPFSRAR
jgi:hypothetical protein